MRAQGQEVCLFGDESAVDDGAYICRAGFAIHSSALPELATQFNAILVRHGVPIQTPSVDTEVKYSPPTGNYFQRCAERHDIYRELLGLIGRNGGWTMGAVFACERTRSVDAERAGRDSLSYFVERAEMLLRALDIRGAVFLDKLTKVRSKPSVAATTQKLILEGSSFNFKFSQLRAEVRELNSREYVGLQLADLVSGVLVHLTAEHVRSIKPPSNEHTAESPFTAQIWAGIQGRFMRLGGAHPRRFGLRIMPSYYEGSFVHAFSPYPPRALDWSNPGMEPPR